MNIAEAKREVVNTVRAYTSRDETGALRIPFREQRPLFLIGPPGIGKTAIMEQAAAECGVNLISYTITHHTRQSAIGLPFIVEKTFGGRTCSVTEYTMSEIIASVYECIERTGISEGILFLDEINCVSETLAPTMLQFLQYKTFGAHRLPEGFVIVTAGNPPQYNRSVRDFDIATLDRIRKITIEEDFAVFRRYARDERIHGSILAFLEIRRDRFYSIRTDVDQTYFVTARGWEDLSRIMQVDEELGIVPDENLMVQYLQDPEAASEFAAYYRIWQKYRDIYRVPEILDGTAQAPQTLRDAPFDERISLIGLLVDALDQEFREYCLERAVQDRLLQILKEVRSLLKDGKPWEEALSEASEALEEEKRRRDFASNLTKDEAHVLHAAGERIRSLKEQLRLAGGAPDAKAAFTCMKQCFDRWEEERTGRARRLSGRLDASLAYMASAFGEGQEMVVFLTELSQGGYSLRFVGQVGSEAYERYNRLLLVKERRDALREEILRLSDE